MPIIDYSTEAAFNELYNYGCIGGYYSENKETIWQGFRHEFFLPKLNIKPNETVLIIGAGFGWIAEKWKSQGIHLICAVDTSPWIHSAKAQHANIDIYDFDVTDYSTHDSIKQILGLQPAEKIDWCITEDFYTEITNQECLDIAIALRALGNNIIHYVPPKPDERLFSIPEIAMRNHKTEEEWSAFLFPDRIVIR